MTTAGQGPVTIRAATTADREGLRSLHRAAYADLRERRYDDHARAWEDGFFAARTAHPEDVLVACAGDRIVGAAYLERQDDGLVLESLEVFPDQQGHGIGSRLLRFVLDRAARDSLLVGLRVHRGNTSARRLYERLGLRVVAEDGDHLKMVIRAAGAG